MRLYSSLFLLATAILTYLGVVAGAATIGESKPSGRPGSSAQLYRKYCSSCHGSDGRAKTRKGKLNHARDLADAKWQDDVTDERIFNSIMNGRNVRGDMPAFGKKISDQEADSLVDYVRRLRR